MSGHLSCGRTDASYESLTPSIHPDNYVKEILGCWIGDPGVSWTQWLILNSSTGVITPRYGLDNVPVNLQSIANIALEGSNSGSYIQSYYVHGNITPNTRNLTKLSPNYNGLVIDNGLGYEIWNDVTTLNGIYSKFICYLEHW